MIFQNELSKLTHDAVTSEFIIPNVGVAGEDYDIAKNFSTAELCFAMPKGSPTSNSPDSKTDIIKSGTKLCFPMRRQPTSGTESQDAPPSKKTTESLSQEEDLHILMSFNRDISLGELQDFHTKLVNCIANSQKTTESLSQEEDLHILMSFNRDISLGELQDFHTKLVNCIANSQKDEDEPTTQTTESPSQEPTTQTTESPSQKEEYARLDCDRLTVEDKSELKQLIFQFSEATAISIPHTRASNSWIVNVERGKNGDLELLCEDERKYEKILRIFRKYL
eukprot:GHVP01022820.1.p1 GENE.GHVP01022820.1~~GHVP01022820.1.p1  ORF type:complete len:280 (+),score=56.95 GHVP01022820.1:128-967(+)